MKSPLLIAVRDGDVGRVRALVRAGADVNDCGDGPNAVVTPLHVAARLEYYDVARYLVLRGGHLGGFFPLDSPHVQACTHRMDARIGRLLRAGPRLYALHRAVRALGIVLYWTNLLRTR